MSEQGYFNSCPFAFLSIRYVGPLVFHIMYYSFSDINDSDWNKESSSGKCFVSEVDHSVITIGLTLTYFVGSEYKEARGSI